MTMEKANLINRAGQRIALTCQISKERTGRLFCEPNGFDISEFSDELTLDCEGGARCEIKITSIGAQHLTFVGRVIA